MSWNINPPGTNKVEHVEFRHGRSISDPYAWLKEDDDPAKDRWLDEQVKYSGSVLASCSSLPLISDRLRQRLSDVKAVELPRVFGGRSFILRSGNVIEVTKSGLERQVAHVPGGNLIIAGNATGSRIAVGITDSSDKVTFQVVDVDASDLVGDPVSMGVATPHILGCIAVGQGALYYSTRMSWSEPVRVVCSQMVGSEPQTLFEADANNTVRMFVSPSERWLAMLIDVGETDTRLLVRDLESTTDWERLLPEASGRIDAYWLDEELLIQTVWNAPNGKLIKVSLTTGDVYQCIPEATSPIIHVSLAGERIFVGYIENVQTKMLAFERDGSFFANVPGMGQVTQSPMFGSIGANRAAFTVSGYCQPTKAHWYNVEHNRVEGEINSDTSIHSEQVFYKSKDGTTIPMTVIRASEVGLGDAPTILFGYGGWGQSLFPWYDPFIAEWVSLGGIYAVANVRGGGEFGARWHEAGRLLNKNNVFDDFECAARWLIDKGYTTPKRLAIRGFSNGGLLMGVMLTRHPELFAAVSAHIAPFDLTDFDVNPSVKLELGDPDDPEHYKNLLSYSPYHNVREGTQYPAVLITAGAKESRVSAHDCLRMTARLQSATSSNNPVLLRYVSDFGHGMNRAVTSLRQQIHHDAEELAFLCQSLGVHLEEIA